MESEIDFTKGASSDVTKVYIYIWLLLDISLMINDIHYKAQRVEIMHKTENKTVYEVTKLVS